MEMDQNEMLRELEGLINDGNTSENKFEIMDILLNIYQDAQENQRQLNLNATKLLNKAAEFLLDQELLDLINTKYQTLRPHFYVLATKGLTNVSSLLNEVILNPKSLKDELKLTDTLVQKLSKDYETRCALIKLLEGASMSEILRSLSVSYPSLSGLRSTAWRILKEKLENSIQNKPCTVEEKRFVQQLWSAQSALRGALFDNRLPLELADDLERCNVTKLIDLSYEKYKELSGQLTKNEKKMFEKLYRKESSFLATRTQTEVSLKQTLMEKIAGAKNLVQTMRNDGMVHQPQLLFLTWSGQKDLPLGNGIPNAEQITQALKSAEDSLKVSSIPFKTDEDFIAGIDGGLSLHGLSYGMDANVICGLAPQPLFRQPQSCLIKETSGPTQKFEEYFLSKEQAENYKKVITEAGFTFGCSLEVNKWLLKVKGDFQRQTINATEESSSSSQFSSRLTMITVHVYPMATYKIDKDQLNLSPSALRSLESIKDMASAENFLDQYGSHFSCGLSQLGGTLCHSIELTAQREQSSESLKSLAKKEMSAALSVEYASLIKVGGHVKQIDTNQQASGSSHQAAKITSRSEITARGPAALQPGLFEELLRASSRSWHIIDRDLSPESLTPVWAIVADNHPTFKTAAELLRKAWLRKSNKIDVAIVRAVRDKVEKRRLNNRDDENEEKIVAELDKLSDVDIDTVNEAILLEQFKTFFQALIHFDYSRTPGVNEESPWITYVAKKTKLCSLLEKLASIKRGTNNCAEKFQRVFRYLSATIDRKCLEKMDHAGFPLSEAIYAMLLDDSSNGNDEQLVETFENSDFQAKLSTVKMSNLVEVLTEEVMNPHTVRDGLQRRIQNILAAALRKSDGQASVLRDAIEDLLVKEYNWSDDAFGEEIPLSNEGLCQLVEKIDRMQIQPQSQNNHEAIDDMDINYNNGIKEKADNFTPVAAERK